MNDSFLFDLSVQTGLPFDILREVSFWILVLILAIVFSFLIKRRFLISFFVCLFFAYVITIKSDFNFLKEESLKAYYFLFLTIGIFLLLKNHFVLEIGGNKLVSWLKSVIIALSVFFIFVRFFFDFFSVTEMKGTTFDFFYKALFFGRFDVFWLILPLGILTLFEKRKKYR